MRTLTVVVLLLIVAGCGGSGNAIPDAIANASPTITILEPSSDVLMAPGPTIRIDYVDDDSEGICTSCLYVDLDGDLATTHDQIALALDRPGGDGARQGVMWDTTGVASGAYTILAVASDGSNAPTGATGPGVITINVPPSISVTGPASDLEAGMGSRVRLAYVDNDSDDAATTDVFADGDGDLLTTGDQHVVATRRAEQNGTPQSVEWDTTGVPEGTYSILAVTSDGRYSPFEATAAGTVTLVNTGLAIELLGDGGHINFVNPLIGSRTTFTMEFWIKPSWPPIEGAPMTFYNAVYVEGYDAGGAQDGATQNNVQIVGENTAIPGHDLGALTLSRWPAPSTVEVFSLPLAEGTWQHVAIVQDAGQLRVYVNGLLEGQGNAQDYSGPAPFFACIGLRHNPVSGDNFGKFVIDDVRLSSTARYATDFVPAVISTVDADTLSLWHFDESFGDLTVDATGNEPEATLIATAQRVVPGR